MTDEIINELRAIREAHAKKFNFDLDAIYEDLKRREEEHKARGGKFVDPPTITPRMPNPALFHRNSPTTHIRRREYVEMLEVLADNRDLELDIYEELGMLNVNIEKLASYRIGMERGEAKGMEKGIEQGIEKGMEQGAHERSTTIAKKLLALGGLSMAQVAATTGLPVAEVEALASQEKPESQ